MPSKLEVIQNTEVGHYAYHGATMNVRFKLAFDTFSVGIFQVVPKSSGTGKKAANVIFRLKGVVGYEDWVNRCAIYICEGLSKPVPVMSSQAKYRAQKLRDAYMLIERAPW